MRKCTHNAKLPSKTPQLFKAKCLKKFTPNYSKYVKLNALMRKIDTDKVGKMLSGWCLPLSAAMPLHCKMARCLFLLDV